MAKREPEREPRKKHKKEIVTGVYPLNLVSMGVPDWNSVYYAILHGYRQMQTTYEKTLPLQEEIDEAKRAGLDKPEPELRVLEQKLLAPRKAEFLQELIDTGILSRERRGNYAVVSVLFNRNLAPRLSEGDKTIELYFTKEGYAREFLMWYRKTKPKLEGLGIIRYEKLEDAGKTKQLSLFPVREKAFPVLVNVQASPSDREQDYSKALTELAKDNDLVGIVKLI